MYDASSKVSKNTSSLNECMFKGPSLSQLLLDVLLRFRLHPTAFICDLEKAFLQMIVNEKDRDALRFLWFKDPFSDDPKLVQLRFAVVLFGLNCAPFLLNGTIRHHLSQYASQFPEDVSKMLRSFYVDDFAGGCANTADFSCCWKI